MRMLDAVGQRLEVNEHVSQDGHPFEQSVFDQVADAVPFSDGQRRVNFDVDVGEVLEPALADPERFDPLHAWHVHGGLANLAQ